MKKRTFGVTMTIDGWDMTDEEARDWMEIIKRAIVQGINLPQPMLDTLSIDVFLKGDK